MNRVWKYELPTEDTFSLVMPKGAQLLTMQTQYGKPCLWALVDAERERETRYFRMAGTGHPIDEGTLLMDRLYAGYVGTCQLFEGSLILHLFEVVPPSGKPSC